MTPYLFVALLLVSTGALAQTQQSTRFGAVPREVFRPVPGGYEMRQGGTAWQPNLTSTPQPLNLAQGIKGRGAFSGGKHFRIDGTGGMKSYDMGGIFDMPVPSTKQTVPVQVVTKGVPFPNVAKAVFRSLPLIATTIAVVDIMNDLAAEWDNQDPAGRDSDGPALYDSEKKSVVRQKSDTIYELGGRDWASPGQACSTYYANSCGESKNAAAVKLGGQDWCYCSNSDTWLGQVTNRQTPKIVPMPESVIEPFATNAPESTKQKIDELLEDMHNKPGFAIDIPNDLPKESSGPATTAPKTETVNKPDGSKVETTTTTDITYQGDQVKIDQRKKTIFIDSSGLETPGDDITVTGETPDPVTSDPTSPGTDDAPLPPGTSNPNQDPNKEPTELDIDICKNNPDILACKKLDPPEEGEIPKEDRDITLQDGPTFGGGACIPNVTVQVFGTSITALNFTEPCRWLADYLKPLLLLMASISAVFIVLPRES
jgi:hypothetical protein